MTVDLFAGYLFGKVALEKIKREFSITENFRLYDAGIVPKKVGHMKVTGAEFKKAKRGKLKGKLCYLIKGTKITVIVTPEDRDKYLTDHPTECLTEY